MLDTLIPRLAADAGIAPVLPDLPNPITAHYRGDHLFLFNWGREERSITLPAPARDLLTETGIVSTVTLPAWGATVMELIL
jgi:beta-galactosidase